MKNPKIGSTFAPLKNEKHEQRKQEEWQEGVQDTHLGRQASERNERHRLCGGATHQVWRGIVVPAVQQGGGHTKRHHVIGVQQADTRTGIEQGLADQAEQARQEGAGPDLQGGVVVQDKR